MAVGQNTKRPCVLLTRPIFDSENLAPRIEAMDADILISPMIEIKEYDFHVLNLDEYDAICVTSANALRIFGQKSDERDIKIYCVGESTAFEAQKMEFKDILSANNSAESLFNLIIDEKPCKVLYLSAKEPSFPLKERFEEVGIVCDVVVTYENKLIDVITEETKGALQSGHIDFVLFYSKKSAENFMTIIERDNLEDTLKSIKALCLSDGMVESLQAKHWAEYAVCDVSNGDGMMNLLAQELAN